MQLAEILLPTYMAKINSNEVRLVKRGWTLWPSYRSSFTPVCLHQSCSPSTGHAAVLLPMAWPDVGEQFQCRQTGVKLDLTNLQVNDTQSWVACPLWEQTTLPTAFLARRDNFHLLFYSSHPLVWHLRLWQAEQTSVLKVSWYWLELSALKISIFANANFEFLDESF